jgi:hypothetical protein
MVLSNLENTTGSKLIFGVGAGVMIGVAAGVDVGPGYTVGSGDSSREILASTSSLDTTTRTNTRTARIVPAFIFI